MLGTRWPSLQKVRLPGKHVLPASVQQDRDGDGALPPYSQQMVIALERFHLFGLANIPTCKRNTWEPFTPLTFNMAKMLKDHGHHVTFYGSAGSDPPCDEIVEIVPADLIAPGLEMSELGVPKAAWTNYVDCIPWQVYQANGRKELRERYRAGDISLISFGAVGASWPRSRVCIASSSAVIRAFFASTRSFRRMPGGTTSTAS